MASTQYYLNDAVSYQGSSYLASAQPVIGTNPLVFPWVLMAARGAMGAAGIGNHEEFLPLGGTNFVDLAEAPAVLLTVARAGVVLSQSAGDYSLAGQRITFAVSFNGAQRVVVAYSTVSDGGAAAGVDSDLRAYVQRVMAIIDPGGAPPPP